MKLRTILSVPAAAALLSGLSFATAPTPQDEGPEGGAQEETGEGGDAEEEEEDEAAGGEERWFAVVGGDVYTGLGEVLRGATLLARNGVIQEIGYELVLPEGAEVLDVEGLRVYPGLVAVNASSRVYEGVTPRDPGHAGGLEDPLDLHCCGGGHEGVPHAEEEGAEPAEPGLDLADLADLGDSFDPFSQYLVLALASGITTVGDNNATLKLKRRGIDGVVLRDRYMTTLPFSGFSPGSKSGLREKFDKARRYLRKHQEWEEKKKTDKDLPEPSRKGVDTTALRILRGELRARFNENDRDELLEIARLAQKYDFRPVINGCREGWAVADELGRAGASAVLTPRERSAKDERLVREGGSSIENAAILHRSGVQVAVLPQDTSISLSGLVGRDLAHLPIEAAFAVRGGLPELAALQAITLVPARLLGVEHRVGSLERGKDCDLIVTDGDLLHYETFVQYAVVEGKLVYDKEEEHYFAHIRPREGADVVPVVPQPVPEQRELP